MGFLERLDDSFVDYGLIRDPELERWGRILKESSPTTITRSFNAYIVQVKNRLLKLASDIISKDNPEGNLIDVQLAKTKELFKGFKTKFDQYKERYGDNPEVKIYNQRFFNNIADLRDAVEEEENLDPIWILGINDIIKEIKDEIPAEDGKTDDDDPLTKARREFNELADIEMPAKEEGGDEEGGDEDDDEEDGDDDDLSNATRLRRANTAERAESLRAKVAARDPDLVTKTRLDSTDADTDEDEESLETSSADEEAPEAKPDEEAPEAKPDEEAPEAEPDEEAPEAQSSGGFAKSRVEIIQQRGGQVVASVKGWSEKQNNYVTKYVTVPMDKIDPKKDLTQSIFDHIKGKTDQLKTDRAGLHQETQKLLDIYKQGGKLNPKQKARRKALVKQRRELESEYNKSYSDTMRDAYKQADRDVKRPSTEIGHLEQMIGNTPREQLLNAYRRIFPTDDSNLLSLISKFNDNTIRALQNLPTYSKLIDKRLGNKRDYYQKVSTFLKRAKSSFEPSKRWTAEDIEKTDDILNEAGFKEKAKRLAHGFGTGIGKYSDQEMELGRDAILYDALAKIIAGNPKKVIEFAQNQGIEIPKDTQKDEMKKGAMRGMSGEKDPSKNMPEKGEKEALADTGEEEELTPKEASKIAHKEKLKRKYLGKAPKRSKLSRRAGGEVKKKYRPEVGERKGKDVRRGKRRYEDFHDKKWNKKKGEPSNWWPETEVAKKYYGKVGSEKIPKILNRRGGPGAGDAYKKQTRSWSERTQGLITPEGIKDRSTEWLEDAVGKFRDQTWKEYGENIVKLIENELDERERLDARREWERGMNERETNRRQEYNLPGLRAARASAKEAPGGRDIPFPQGLEKPGENLTDQKKKPKIDTNPDHIIATQFPDVVRDMGLKRVRYILKLMQRKSGKNLSDLIDKFGPARISELIGAGRPGSNVSRALYNTWATVSLDQFDKMIADEKKLIANEEDETREQEEDGLSDEDIKLLQPEQGGSKYEKIPQERDSVPTRSDWSVSARDSNLHGEPLITDEQFDKMIADEEDSNTDTFVEDLKAKYAELVEDAKKRGYQKDPDFVEYITKVQVAVKEAERKPDESDSQYLARLRSVMNQFVNSTASLLNKGQGPDALDGGPLSPDDPPDWGKIGQIMTKKESYARAMLNNPLIESTRISANDAANTALSLYTEQCKTLGRSSITSMFDSKKQKLFEDVVDNLLNNYAYHSQLLSEAGLNPIKFRSNVDLFTMLVDFVHITSDPISENQMIFKYFDDPKLVIESYHKTMIGDKEKSKSYVPLSKII